MKKIFSILTAFSLTIAGTSVSAYRSDDIIKFVPDVAEETESNTVVMEQIPFEDSFSESVSNPIGLNGSFRPSIIKQMDTSNGDYWNITPVDADGNEIKFDVDETVEGLETEETLPSKYDSREAGYVTSVKNQAAYGICWAHSTCAAFETNMLKKGYEGELINYSETHLSYFVHSRDTARGDGYKYYNDAYGYYAGGNPINAMYYLADGQGMAYESEYLYPPTDKTATLPESDRHISHACITSSGLLYSALSETTQTLMKQAIVDHGGICIAYYHDSDYVSENAAFYQDTDKGANHSVFVVGWDDDYSVDNFNSSCKPTGNGAWLVKGSYGDWEFDNGYMWLSYEDESICDMCWFEAEPTTDDVILSYNGSLLNSYYNNYIANVFAVSQDETISSVGFTTYTGSSSPSSTAKVKIIVYNEKPAGPVAEDYKSATEYSVEITRDGFYKCALPSSIDLKKGQYVSVVLMNDLADGKIANNEVEYNSNYSSNAGESYIFLNESDKIKDSEGNIVTGWVDVQNIPDNTTSETLTYSTHNVGVKLYGNIISDTATVSFETKGGTEISSQTVTKGEKITKPDDPTLDGYTFKGWYSNASFTKEYDFTVPISENITIYAKWSSPSDYCSFPWGRAFQHDGTGGIMMFAVCGDSIASFDWMIYSANGLSGIVAGFSHEKANYFLSGTLLKKVGKYLIKARVYGINGEIVDTNYSYMEFTTKPYVTKIGAYMSAINMDKDNIPTVIGCGEDTDGVYVGSVTDFSNDTIIDEGSYYFKFIPKAYRGYNYSMIDNSTLAPLCITSDTYDQQIVSNGLTASMDEELIKNIKIDKIINMGTFDLEQ